MRVRVPQDKPETFTGFINHIRRRPGDVFSIDDEPRRPLFKGEQKLVDGNDQAKAVYAAIKDKAGMVPKDFSFQWMEPVDAALPEKITTAQTALDQRSDMIRAEKAAARDAALGGEAQSRDVL